MLVRAVGVVGGISLSAAADQLPADDFPVVDRAVQEATTAISVALGALADPAAATA